MLSDSELKARLSQFARIIAAQAIKDKDFRDSLCELFGQKPSSDMQVSIDIDPLDLMASPFAVLQERGQEGFRMWVSELSIDELKKVISAHRLDSTGNARKWKTKDKLVEFVFERVSGRSKQGDAFKDYGDLPGTPSEATHDHLER